MGNKRISVAPASCNWSILALLSFRFTNDCTATQLSSSNVLTVGDLLPGVMAKA